MTRYALALLFVACVLAQSPTWAGVDFEDGTGDSYEDSTVALCQPADVPFTVAAWIKVESVAGSAKSVFSIGDNGGNFYVLYVNTDSKVYWSVNTGTSAAANTTTTVTLGQWHSVVAVENAGDDRAVYLDGAGKGTNTTAKNPTGLDQTVIGALGRSPNILFFDGVIAYVAVWKGKGFTDADALSWHNGAHPSSLHLSNLAAFWPMFGDGPVGTRLRDMVGSVALTTVSGSPAKADSPPIRGPRPRYSQLGRPRILDDVRQFTRCREEDCYAAA